MSRIFGPVISALEITTFCWFPPDRLETGCSGLAISMPSRLTKSRAPLASAFRHRVLSQLYNHVVPSMGLDPLPDDSIDRLGKIAEETYPRSEAADYIALRDRRTIGMLESRE